MKIEHISYCLGEERRSIRDWCAINDCPAELQKRFADSGLDKYFDHGDKNIDELAIGAVSKLFQDTGLSMDDIDMIVFFHTQQCSVPAGARDIGHLLNDHFNVRCPAFSVSQQNCVSSLVAIDLIQRLFNTQPHLQRVLLVGADAIGIEGLRSVNGGVGFHSDGGVASTLVRSGEKNELLTTEFLSFAEHYRGMDSPPELAAVLDRQYYLATHKVISSTLKKAGISTADLRWIFPHNVNVPGWKAIAAGIKLPDDRIFTRNIKDKSHIYGCDGLINLADAMSENELQKGDYYLVFSMGYGGFFGAGAFQY